MSSSKASPASTRQPNILLIQADQLTPMVLPAYGHPQVKAPHIQQLADTGVVFDNAYCNFPLCVPSRASMMSGRLANDIECWDNATEMPASIPTIAHYLRSVGYHTTLCGKMHFVGPDQVHGFNERITTDIYPSNFSWTPDWQEGETYRPTGINMSAVVDAGICTRSLQLDYDEMVEFNGIQKIHDLARFNDDKPFFLTVSFTHPHSPYITTEEYWNRYDHDDIDLPAVPAIPLEEQDEMSRWLHYAHAAEKHTITDDHIRNARHAYYGMTSYIDDKVGNLMKTLKATGLDENTVVIITSDHGEMLGERGMWYKQCFYEWSARVPFIVNYPKAFAPRRVEENMSLVDLLPTLLDLATDGNPPAPVSPLDGNSLTPLMRGDNSNWDNAVISEYTGEGVNAPCRMLKRGDYKYIYTHGYPAQLFNLKSDPRELENLAGDAELKELEEAMKVEILNGWDPESITTRAIRTQQERFLIQRSTDGDPTWSYEVRDNGDNRYPRNAGAVQTKARARFPFVTTTPFEN